MARRDTPGGANLTNQRKSESSAKAGDGAGAVSPLELAAYHQAGHAVTAYLLGHEFGELTVNPEAGGPFNNSDVILRYQDSPKAILDTLLQVRLAGAWTEACRLAVASGGKMDVQGRLLELHDGDAEAVVDLAVLGLRQQGTDPVALSDEARAKLLEKYIDEAGQRLGDLLSRREHWAAIVLLAAGLSRRQIISTAEAMEGIRRLLKLSEMAQKLNDDEYAQLISNVAMPSAAGAEPAAADATAGTSPETRSVDSTGDQG